MVSDKDPRTRGKGPLRPIGKYVARPANVGKERDIRLDGQMMTACFFLFFFLITPSWLIISSAYECHQSIEIFIHS